MFFIDETKTTEEVAKELLGCLLISETDKGTTTGWIVETEAYIGMKDAASHSFGGKNTPRLQAMYSDPGTIYLYQMHTHILLNIVTQPEGIAQAVLIRAVQPESGIELMNKRRGKKGIELTNGPGKLTKAFGITMNEYGTLIEEPPLFIDFKKKKIPNLIETSPRIGIPNKGEWTDALLRYTVKDNPYISRRRGKIDKEKYGWK